MEQRQWPRKQSREKNKIAQGDVNIFSHLTFKKKITFFATLIGNDASNRLNISTFVGSRLISVEIGTSLALFKKNIFSGHFDFFRKLPIDLADFK